MRDGARDEEHDHEAHPEQLVAPARVRGEQVLQAEDHDFSMKIIEFSSSFDERSKAIDFSRSILEVAVRVGPRR